MIFDYLLNSICLGEMDFLSCSSNEVVYSILCCSLDVPSSRRRKQGLVYLVDLEAWAACCYCPKSSCLLLAYFKQDDLVVSALRAQIQQVIIVTKVYCCFNADSLFTLRRFKDSDAFTIRNFLEFLLRFERKVLHLVARCLMVFFVFNQKSVDLSYLYQVCLLPYCSHPYQYTISHCYPHFLGQIQNPSFGYTDGTTRCCLN